MLIPMFAVATLASSVSTPTNEVPEIKSGFGTELSADGKGFRSPSAVREASAGEPTRARSIIYTQGGRWPDITKVPVCHVNPEVAGDIVRDIENWVPSEYRRVGIGFVWQGKCVDMKLPNQIRVWYKQEHFWNVRDEINAGGGLSYLGPVNAPLGGSEGPGTMNIMIGKDIVGYPTNGFQSWVVTQTRATAVHEFGHALGLAHEQERTDAPICGDIRGTLPNGGAYIFVGAYDPKSIMNYCKNGGGDASLSEGDLQGLRTLYPKLTQNPDNPLPSAPKGAYSIRVRSTNKCVELPNNMNANGVRLKQVDCSNAPGQAFKAESLGNGWYQFKAATANRCIDIPGSSTSNGARLQIFDCNGTPAQKFRLEDRGSGFVSVINQNSGKCWGLEVRSGAIQQTDCSSEGHKVFGFFGAGAITPAGKSL